MRCIVCKVFLQELYGLMVLAAALSTSADDVRFGLFIQLLGQKAELEQPLVHLKHQFLFQQGILLRPLHPITCTRFRVLPFALL